MHRSLHGAIVHRLTGTTARPEHLYVAALTPAIARQAPGAGSAVVFWAHREGRYRPSAIVCYAWHARGGAVDATHQLAWLAPRPWRDIERLADSCLTPAQASWYTDVLPALRAAGGCPPARAL